MGKLTTHVLDTMHGSPAAGMAVRLYRLDASGNPQLLQSLTLNADGRAPAPLLEGEAFQPGVYELSFHVGDYFRRLGIVSADPAFLTVVPVRFGLSKAQHYHVPLLVSPYGYSTYRGS